MKGTSKQNISYFWASRCPHTSESSNTLCHRWKWSGRYGTARFFGRAKLSLGFLFCAVASFTIAVAHSERAAFLRFGLAVTSGGGGAWRRTRFPFMLKVRIHSELGIDSLFPPEGFFRAFYRRDKRTTTVPFPIKGDPGPR